MKTFTALFYHHVDGKLESYTETIVARSLTAAKTEAKERESKRRDARLVNVIAQFPSGWAVGLALRERYDKLTAASNAAHKHASEILSAALEAGEWKPTPSVKYQVVVAEAWRLAREASEALRQLPPGEQAEIRNAAWYSMARAYVECCGVAVPR